MLPEISEIKARRKAAGMTQGQLAQLTNVSQSLIAKIESGQLVPSYDKAKRVFDSLEKLHVEAAVKAKDIMTRKIIFISPNGSVKNAIKLMEKNALSQLPVLDDGKSVGTISEKTILNSVGSGKHANPETVKVGEIMEDSLPLIQLSTPIDLLSQMLGHNIALLVQDKGKIVGIITKADLLKVILKGR